MLRGYGRLDRVRPLGASGAGTPGELEAAANLVRIPEAAVLIGQQDQLSVRPDPRTATGVAEHHQRQQADDLALLGKHGRKQPGQPDRLSAELLTK